MAELLMIVLQDMVEVTTCRLDFVATYSQCLWLSAQVSDLSFGLVLFSEREIVVRVYVCAVAVIMQSAYWCRYHSPFRSISSSSFVRSCCHSVVCLFTRLVPTTLRHCR